MRRLLLLLSLWLLVGCGEGEPSVCRGRYLEIEGYSTLTLRTEGEKGGARTVRFLIDESEMDHPEALLVGSPLTVYYRGKLQGDKPCRALRIEVDETYARLVGRWLESEERELDMGVGLEAGGRAYSIGMQTIAFEKWEYLPEGLRLSGNTLGGGNSVPFSEVWNIEELTDEQMTLSQPDLVLRFHRETDADIEAREARIEAERLAREKAKAKAKSKRK